MEVAVEATPPAVLPRDTDAATGAGGVRRVFPAAARSSSAPAAPSDPGRARPPPHPDRDDRPGAPDSHTHSPNERMLLETFLLGVAAVCETYRALAAL